MRTRVCELFGIEFPIFAFSHCRDVVAAVSRAGGMGVLGAVRLTPEELEVDLRWIEDRVGERPYGIDVVVPTAFVGSDRGGLSADKLEALVPEPHRRFVNDLLERYGVPALPPDEIPQTTNRAYLVGANARDAGRLLDVALAHRISLIANALGPPPPEMIERAKERGVPVAALAGRVDHARRHVEAGVDVIVAQGYEAGGHTGDIATMVLVPEVVDAVYPLPVLAAGGIARGRQVAAALALGAEGVWTGSVWLTTVEAETHPAVKQKFLTASSSDTVRSRSTTGKPARQLRSAWTEEWDDPGNPEPLGMPLQSVLVAEARDRIERSAHQPGSGAERLINYFVGQVVGSLDRVKPARQVVFEMMDELIDVIADMEHAVATATTG